MQIVLRRLLRWSLLVLSAVLTAASLPAFAQQRYSYDILSVDDEWNMSVLFLPDKALMKSSFWSGPRLCDNEGLVIPKGRGETRLVDSADGPVTGSYDHRGADHHLSIRQAHRQDGTIWTERWELTVRLAGSSCQILTYKKKEPWSVQPAETAGGRKCVARPFADFEKAKSEYCK